MAADTWYLVHDSTFEAQRAESWLEAGSLCARVPLGELWVLDGDVFASGVQVELGEPPLVSVLVAAPGRLDDRYIDELKRRIAERVGRDILLEAQLRIRR